MTIWAIVPAAGIGRRMGSITPKQYLNLNGLPVIAHSLQKLANVAAIRQIVVVLHPQDKHFATLSGVPAERIITATGGDERFQSVIGGLNALARVAHAKDWVLVHDAVRPCVRQADIEKLIAGLSGHDVGGLLGVPVNDTLKKVNDAAAVEATIDRSHYWQAQTPQMFRYGLLVSALTSLIAANARVTDEAEAIERQGLQPQLVAGHADNLKITREADLILARNILQSHSNVADTESGQQ